MKLFFKSMQVPESASDVLSGLTNPPSLASILNYSVWKPVDVDSQGGGGRGDGTCHGLSETDGGKEVVCLERRVLSVWHGELKTQAR